MRFIPPDCSDYSEDFEIDQEQIDNQYEDIDEIERLFARCLA